MYTIKANSGTYNFEPQGSILGPLFSVRQYFNEKRLKVNTDKRIVVDFNTRKVQNH